MATTNPILYPNISRVPSQESVQESKRSVNGEAPIQKGEFDQSLNQALTKMPPENLKSAVSANANAQIQGLKFSAHATQRLRERQIHFDTDTLMKMNDAITKADAKGVQDTLVLTDKAALIVSVPNRTVITAMDRNNMAGNVFTNIDGAVII